MNPVAQLKKVIEESLETTIPSKPSSKRLFLNNEDRVSSINNNLRVMLDTFQKSYAFRSIIASSWSEDHDVFNEKELSAGDGEKFINWLVRYNSIFQKVNLERFLGAGSFGAVWLLDNDHVLKVFSGSLDNEAHDHTAAKDRTRYDMEADKLFSGLGSNTNLMVYDHGRLRTMNGKTMYWVEMQKVDMLVDVVAVANNKTSDRDKFYLEDELQEIIVTIKSKIRHSSESDEHKLVLSIKDWIKRLYTIVPDRLLLSLISEMVKVAKNEGVSELGDVRTVNIGVSPSDPNSVVLFDR